MTVRQWLTVSTIMDYIKNKDYVRFIIQIQTYK